MDPSSFMAAAAAPMNGNTPWAQGYAQTLRRVVHESARYAPRNTQIHLGPSELGVRCDRQVAGKLAGIPETNHVTDPWPSVVGTAVHAWLADAFEADNRRHGHRWLPENRVYPHPDHSGTGDLYDMKEAAVVDHKILGESSLEKVKRSEGPPRKYRVQLWLYGLGFTKLGYPVTRVALAAYPRTKASLDDMYVWDEPYSPAVDELIEEVWSDTARRKAWASLIRMGATLNDIPMIPDDDECYFCPFYRPQSAHDNGPGCPGTITKGNPT